MSYLSVSTWRHLGLGVGLSYIALGSYYSFEPDKAAELFGLAPERRTIVTDERLTSEVLTAIEATEGAHKDANRHWMYLVGARDVAIGLAICHFYYAKNAKAIGVTIMSGMVVCVVDTFEIWRLKGPKDGLSLGIGATIWAIIGANLLQE